MDIWDLVSRILVINLMRYFLVAGGAFVIFYILFKNKWSYRKIQSKFPKAADYRREILYSLITISIFLGVGVLVFGTAIRGYTLRYDKIQDFGCAYWVISIFLMILLHDTYFYWMHRLMHHPRLYRRIHLIHHKSTNPSPLAAYAFHPLEAVVEASIFFLIVFMIPFHRTALLTFLIFMIFYNVYGHLGYELYPRGFNKTKIGRWLNTSVNHNQHHEKVKGNYGLYFLFWDRWLGTIREDYDQAFEESDHKRLGKPRATVK